MTTIIVILAVGKLILGLLWLRSQRKVKKAETAIANLRFQRDYICERTRSGIGPDTAHKAAMAVAPDDYPEVLREEKPCV